MLMVSCEECPGENSPNVLDVSLVQVELRKRARVIIVSGAAEHSIARLILIKDPHVAEAVTLELPHHIGTCAYCRGKCKLSCPYGSSDTLSDISGQCTVELKNLVAMDCVVIERIVFHKILIAKRKQRITESAYCCEPAYDNASPIALIL